MRGPFQGTWQQGIRPTVVTSPDALVYINGETEVIGCASCHRRFDLNKYITSVQIDLSVDSVPGSATIDMTIPRHSVDEFYFDGNPLITPMMEVEIFAKGYYLVEGLPQYYPIFWGIITEVTDNYSSGQHTFNIHCADILKWWELCKMNINPAFTASSGQLGKSIFGNVLFGTNPYDMIWALAQQAFGDVVVGSGSLVSLYKEGQQKQTFNAALSDIMLYWQRRFSKIRSNLLLYGTQGNAVRGDILYQTYQKEGGAAKFSAGKAVPFASQTVRQANGGAEASQMVFDPTDPSVTAFRTQFSQAGQVNFWTSEFQSKLEIANACKDAIGFEFYMDVTGDIVFKPPFYNLDILSNKPVSWIQDIDIIDWDLSESEAEVVTQIQLSGSFGGNVDYGFGEEATPQTSVTDYHLLRKYGWRTQTFNSEFSASPLQMFYMGLDMLDRYNSRRHRGSINIPLRPELRLGFPIYIAPKDQVWYISGISHNIQFGGRAQTTLSLTAKRSKFLAPKGIGSIELTGYSGEKKKEDAPSTGPLGAGLTTKQLAQGGQFKASVGDAAQLPPTGIVVDDLGDNNPYEPLVLRHPKTGRLCGYPNVVMAYTRPFTDPTPGDFAKAAGRKDPNAGRSVAQFRKEVDKEAPKLVAEATQESLTATQYDQLREKYINNRYSYGLNSAGVYTYLYDKSSVLKEFIILPAKNITFDEESVEKLKFEGSSGMVRPVSDERGFEVVGHFRYGRGCSLRDGSLVLNVSAENPAADNSRAEIDFQLALSGELTETLQAQSQGLTSRNTATANPAATLAKMAPEDLQSAATINPDTKEPEFVNTGTNFVDAAPLGTPKQQGVVNSTSVASVEASQLSRALTLAEMAVKEAVMPEECDCLLGRSDLAFINTGYQIDVLGASTTAAVGNEGYDAAKLQASELMGQQEAAVAKAIEGAAPDQVELLTANAISDFQREHAAEFTEIGDAIGNNIFLGDSSSQSLPVADFIYSHAQTIGKVEKFLTTLYSALDTSHQQYEAGLRGDAISFPQTDVKDIRFGTPKDLGPTAPPFGAPGRAQGDATAQDVIDAVDAWDDFGASIEAKTKRAELQLEINALQHEVGRLQALVNSALTLGLEPDPEFVKELGDAKQALLEKQQELNVLNATYPP